MLMFKDDWKWDQIKTIGLRVSEDSLELVHKVSKEVLDSLMSKYGLDVTEGTTLMRLAISNLVSNPPNTNNIQNIAISCKDDSTFVAFLNNILEETKAQWVSQVPR